MSVRISPRTLCCTSRCMHASQSAREGTADFDAIHGRHDQAAGPVRAQYSVALEAAGDFAAEGENGLGRLALERIADGVVADWPNAFGQCSPAALGFDLQQAGHLHGRGQEDRIEHLLPTMCRRLTAFRQRAYQLGKIEHLVEVRLEPVPGQAYRLSFSLRNLLRLMPQMVAAAASKRWRISTCWRTFETSLAGMLKVLGLPSTSTET